MKTGKIGAIFLISILALAGIGAGYAAWTDTITIDGKVNTGDVDLVVVAYSGTWIWKCISSHEMITHRDYTTADGLDPNGFYGNDDYELVSFATAEQATDIDGTLIDDAVTVTFDNLFPCVWLWADVLLHYEGSIPVRVDDIFLSLDAPLLGVLDSEIKIYRTDSAGSYEGALVERGTQLHNCNYIKVIIGVHVPTQEDILMNLEGTITGRIVVKQWNEFIIP